LAGLRAKLDLPFLAPPATFVKVGEEYCHEICNYDEMSKFPLWPHFHFQVRPFFD